MSQRKLGEVHSNFLDKVYDKAYIEKEQVCFDRRPMVCLFDYNKEKY